MSSEPQPYQPSPGQQPDRAPQPAVRPQPRPEYRPTQQFRPEMRCANADRERTVDVLRAAFAEGRLTAPELEERTEAVYAAATYRRLNELVADLPAGPMPFGSATEPGGRGPFAPPPRPERRRVNPTAVAALVLGLLEVPTMGLTGPGALICGHLARGQIRERGEQGEGMATAGVALGWLAVAGWALVLVVLVVAGVAIGSHTAVPGGR